jgi:DNA primase
MIQKMYDIESFLERNFDEIIPYGDGTDVRVNCPFCEYEVGSEDLKAHLHVSLVKEVCHCFRCNYSKSWAGLVMEITGFDYAQALGELYRPPKPSKFDEIKGLWDEDIPEVPNVALPADFSLLEEGKSVLAARAKRYMMRRGFKKYHWERYGLGVAKSIGIRIIIPIEGDYWQARAIIQLIKPKYINPKSESKKVLFNPGALESYKEVVICEGAFSAMAVGDNAIALVGKSATRAKLERLKQSDVEHFIVTIEEGAERDMFQLSDELTGVGKQVTVWQYNEGDPADSTDYNVKPYDFGTKLKFLLES